MKFSVLLLLIWTVKCQETCPPSSIFTCFHEPCQFAECPAVPDATCTNDYCLGCNAVFTDSRGRKLTEKECNEGKLCPSLDDRAALGAFTYFCTKGNNIGSVCFLQCPVGQHLEKGPTVVRCWRKGKWTPKIRRPRCETVEEECPPSKPAVKCPKSPCRNAECPRYPNATCTDDNCGACTAIFTDADDNILSEEKCKCEPGVRLVSCTTAPCDTASCPGVKQARCIDNYCGSCSAIFTDRIGHVLTEEQCRLPESTCKLLDYRTLHSTVKSITCSKGNRVGSTCKLKCPANHSLRGPSRINCRKRGKRYQWTGSFAHTQCVLQRRGNNCPAYAPRVKCRPRPCDSERCPRYPEATCTENYCGACTATFTDGDGNVISKQNCTCEPNIPLVNCANNPCEVARCPGVRQAVCKVNRCGTCTAAFVDKAGNELLESQCEPEEVCPSLENILIFSLITISCDDEYRKGSTCRATCPQNYDIRGPSRMTCRKSGKIYKWSSTFARSRCRKDKNA
ncbi:E-selectin-like [Clavelina lepadiformis]|uniref:E-selectin-like n=1 Tax=Clavelina lepadiformis TaxID=159417 RepID=UPI004042BA77